MTQLNKRLSHVFPGFEQGCTDGMVQWLHSSQSCNPATSRATVGLFKSWSSNDSVFTLKATTPQRIALGALHQSSDDSSPSSSSSSLASFLGFFALGCLISSAASSSFSSASRFFGFLLFLGLGSSSSPCPAFFSAPFWGQLSSLRLPFLRGCPPRLCSWRQGDRTWTLRGTVRSARSLSAAVQDEHSGFQFHRSPLPSSGWTSKPSWTLPAQGRHQSHCWRNMNESTPCRTPKGPGCSWSKSLALPRQKRPLGTEQVNLLLPASRGLIIIKGGPCMKCRKCF